MTIASVRFLQKQSGVRQGRIEPPQTGYQPAIGLGGVFTSCLIESVDGKLVFPFEEVHLVSLKLMFPDQYPSAFIAGMKVEFFEGNILVGQGTILSV